MQLPVWHCMRPQQQTRSRGKPNADILQMYSYHADDTAIPESGEMVLGTLQSSVLSSKDPEAFWGCSFLHLSDVNAYNSNWSCALGVFTVALCGESKVFGRCA